MSGHRKTTIRFIQDAIDKGATTVEEIHKAVADLPLKILEDNDVMKESAKQAKRLQDHTLGAIYDVIREINEQVGTYASELLAEAEKRRAGRMERQEHVATAGAVHSHKQGAHHRKSA